MSNFWRLFHSLVRQSDTPEELQRATDSCVWLAENTAGLRKAISVQESEILSYVISYWTKHKKAPSFDILKESIERKSTSPGIMEKLSEYSELEDLRTHSPEDLGQILVELNEEHDSDVLNSVLKITRAINSGSYEDPKTKKKIAGPKEAVRYLFQQVEAGSLNIAKRTVVGSVNENARDLQDIYSGFKKDRLSGTLRINTGLDGIDKHVALKKGDFVGVLGYAGQRKSGLCRTISYNAAMAGFNILHVSLEQTYEEELSIYGLMHAHHPKWGNRFKLSKKAFDDGDFTPEEEKFFFGEVLPDLENGKAFPGQLIIRQPTEGTTWEAIKTVAEITNQTTPLHMFFIDYLTMCQTQSRDSKQEMEEIIKDAKQFALHFDSGRAITLLSPVQGNRDGWSRASENEGQWELNGIYMYPEYDKSLDTLLTVFLNDDLKAESQIVIGSAKTRRSEGVPLFKAAMNNNAGKISNLLTYEASDTQVDDVLEEF